MNGVFITGEKINLCSPQEGDFDKWASWFNDPKVTKFLEQGKYPNSTEQQKAFYRQAIESGRFITLIKDKEHNLLGVISLSEINYEKSNCQIALVCPESSPTAMYAPLEAMALCTQHAFDRFGLESIFAGQAYPELSKWANRLEILGYKTYGISRKGFRHGMIVSDALKISVRKEYYIDLLARRSGKLWPGEEKVTKILAALKRHAPLARQVDDALISIHKKHSDLIEEIELNAI